MIHESKDKGVLTIDLIVGLAAMALMTYVILHPQLLGHMPSEPPPAKEVSTPVTKQDSIVPEFTDERLPGRTKPRLQLASLGSGDAEPYYLEEFHPVEDPDDDFANYDLQDPMLKGSFYEHIQTQRYLLSEEKHAESTVRIRKFLHAWGLTVSAIPEAVDLAWENQIAANALEKQGEGSESHMSAHERFRLSKARFSANHAIDNPLFWKELLQIQPDAPYGEMAMGILAQNIH